MSKRKHVDDQPMSDAEYQQFQQLQHFDAASLRALALWLNTKKKNAALMKAVTAEMGRNARHMARAVDYWPPYFIRENPVDAYPSASQYLMLFEYAKLNRENATNLFKQNGFVYPLYQLREKINDARRNGHGAKRATPSQILRSARDLADAWLADTEPDSHIAMSREALETTRQRARELMGILDGEPYVEVITRIAKEKVAL